MRNLKRVLSLALAVVMVIGMMVMGAGAADFTDKAEITYTEAVEVAAALGLINGIEAADGTYSFNPDGILTREGAAKLICYMLMGPENAEMLTATKTFSDVAATRWSAPYISYCVSLGYIAGNGDGTFNPTGKLTGVAFAKLLLCALGYDAEIEGYVNNKDWATNIGTDAIEAGLNIKGVNLNAQLTREQAAQMILNTLQAPMVEYDSIASYFGVSKVEYVTTTLAKEQRISSQQLTNSTDYTVEFGEKYFPTLSLIPAEDAMARPAHEWLLKNETIGLYADTPDYEGYIAGKNSDVEKFVDSISKRFNDADAEIYVNGLATEEALANKDALGNYVEIYMDRESANVVDRICVTHNTVAEIDGVKTVVSGGKTYVVVGDLVTKSIDKVVGWEQIDDSVIMYHVDNAGVYHLIDPADFGATMTATTDETGKTSVEDPTYFHIGDKVYEVSGQTDAMDGNELVTLKGNTTGHYWLDGAGYVIHGTGTTAVAPIDLMLVLKNNEFKEGTVFKGDTIESQVLFVNADGEVKIVDIAEVGGVAAGVVVDDNNTPDDTSDDSEVVTAPIELDDETADHTVAEATQFEANVNFDDAVLYKYTVNTDGSYKLTALTKEDDATTPTTGDKYVKVTDDTKLIKGIPSAFGTDYTDVIITDSKTIYLVRNTHPVTGAYVDSYTAYTGFANLPSMTAHGADIYGAGTAQYVVISDYTLITAGSTAAQDVAYVLDNEITAHYNAKGEIAYFTVSALIDGEKTTLKIAEGAEVLTVNADGEKDLETVEAAENPLVSYTLYIVTSYDKDGNVDAMAEAVTSAATTEDGEGNPVDNGTFYWVGLVGSQAAKNDKIVLNTDTTNGSLTYATSFAYDEKCVVYTISGEDDVVITGDITTLTTDANDEISMIVVGKVYGTAPNNTALVIYVHDIADEEIEEDDGVDASIVVDLDTDPAAVTVTGTDDLAVALAAIENELVKAGWTVTEKTYESGSYTFAVSKTVAGFTQTAEYTYTPA